MEKSRIVLVVIVCIIGFSHTTISQEVGIGNAQNINELKAGYKERQSNFESEKKRLQSLLKSFSSVTDTTASEQILNSFSKITKLADSKLPVPEKSAITSGVQKELPDRHKSQLQKLNRKWSASKAEWQHYAQSDSTLKNYWQQLKADTVLMAKAEQKLLDHLKKELGDNPLLSQKDPMAEMTNTFKQLEGLTDKEAAYAQLTNGAFEYSPEELANMTPEKVVGPLLGKDNLVENAHTNMWKLKQKYSKVQNSNDLSTAIKSNSLEGSSLDKRLKLGGTFQFHSMKNGLQLDVSPSLAYQLNKDFLIGLGATYRASFGERKESDIPVSVYGGRLYSQHKLFKGFLLHAETEFLSVESTIPNSEKVMTKQTQGFLAGLGKEFKFIKGLSASTLWLYHFNHTKTSAYKSPWVFRLGFSFDKKVN